LKEPQASQPAQSGVGLAKAAKIKTDQCVFSLKEEELVGEGGDIIVEKIRNSAAKVQQLTTYKTSLSRDSLKYGCYKPISITIVQETPLDESVKETFYHPAVVLLDKISKANYDADGKEGEANG